MTNRDIECLSKIETLIDTQRRAVEDCESRGCSETAEWIKTYIFGLEAAVAVMKETLD